MSVSAQLDGDTQALLARMKNLSQVKKTATLRNIAEGLRTSTMERFRNTSDPEGNQWETSIRARAEGGLTLTKSGSLKNSIQSQVSLEGATVGTNDIRAATHQYGEDSRTIRAKNGKYLRFKVNGAWRNVESVTVSIPARPFLGISQEDQQDIKEILEDELRE